MFVLNDCGPRGPWPQHGYGMGQALWVDAAASWSILFGILRFQKLTFQKIADDFLRNSSACQAHRILDILLGFTCARINGGGHSKRRGPGMVSG